MLFQEGKGHKLLSMWVYHLSRYKNVPSIWKDDNHSKQYFTKKYEMRLHFLKLCYSAKGNCFLLSQTNYFIRYCLFYPISIIVLSEVSHVSYFMVSDSSVTDAEYCDHRYDTLCLVVLHTSRNKMTSFCCLALLFCFFSFIFFLIFK